MMITMQNRNIRAIDRLFDRLTGFSGMSSPLAMVDGWFARAERQVNIANGPEDGIVTRYELVEKHYKREVKESGDVIFRLLSADEVRAIETNKKEDAMS